MKKIFIFSVCVFLLFFIGTVFAPDYAMASVCYFEGEEEEAYKFIEKKGRVYIFDGQDKRVRNEFADIDGNTYYAGKNGEMYKGWLKKDNEYYLLSRTNGVMQIGKAVDGVKINLDGMAVKTKAAVNKINTMIKAGKVVNKICKPSDKKAVKLKKCFDWVISFPYVRYRKLEKIYKKNNWEVTFANDIFDREAGCCVSDAAAFAFLAKECGYTGIYVGHDTSHAWTEIGKYVYDPLFAEAKNYDKYYRCPYKSYGLHHIGRRKV